MRHQNPLMISDSNLIYDQNLSTPSTRLYALSTSVARVLLHNCFVQKYNTFSISTSELLIHD